MQQDICPVSRTDGGTPCPVRTPDFQILEVFWVLGVLHHLPGLSTYKTLVAITKDGCVVTSLVGNHVKLSVLGAKHGERHLIPNFHIFHMFSFRLKAGTIPTLQGLRGVNGWLSYAFINTTIL